MTEKVYWKNPGYTPHAPLRGGVECKYLIVGAGISGVMTAYFLLESDVPAKDIVVIEKSTVGSGSTGRSAGMLIPEPENEKNFWWDTFIEKFGLEDTTMYRKAHIDVLDLLENLIQTHGINCSAGRQDFLILGTKKFKDRLEADLRARLKLGEKAEGLEGDALAREFRSSRFIFGERTVQGLSVNPLALVQGLAGMLRTRGVEIFEYTPLTGVEGTIARTTAGEVQFETIIYASGMGSQDSRLGKYATTIAVTEALPLETLQKINLDDKDMFIEDLGEDSFFYGKILEDNRMLIGFGDQKTASLSAAVSLVIEHVKDIEDFLAKSFPHVRMPIEFAWSGGYALSRDFLPLVEIKDNMAVINGAGIQVGSIVAARHLVAQLCGTSSDLTPLWAKKL